MIKEERILFKNLDSMVHFKLTTENWVDFEVYPVTEWFDLNGNGGWAYCDIEDEQYSIYEFEEGKCFIKLKGSVVSRGVLEARLYFLDEEYWGEELGLMNNLYSKHILPKCKELINWKSND